MAFVKKANPATEAVATDNILGQGAASLNKGVADISKAVTAALSAFDSAFANAQERIDTLVPRADELSLLVADRTRQVADLESDYAEKLEKQKNDFAEKTRQYNIDFNLAVKENEDAFIKAWLTRNGLITTTQNTLDDLKMNYDILKGNYADEVSKEVKKAVAIAENSHSNAIKLKEAEFAAKEAQNTARLVTLEEKIVFLTEQANSWKSQLDDERKAGTERAKASQTVIQQAPQGR